MKSKLTFILLVDILVIFGITIYIINNQNLPVKEFSYKEARKRRRSNKSSI